MAKRDITRIIVNADPDSKRIGSIEVQCIVIAEEGGITITDMKQYSVEYSDLGANPKQHIKDVVLDAQKFLSIQEPLTDTDILILGADAALQITSTDLISTDALLA